MGLYNIKKISPPTYIFIKFHFIGEVLLAKNPEVNKYIQFISMSIRRRFGLQGIEFKKH